jgi:serine O-acetyltransferase
VANPTFEESPMSQSVAEAILLFRHDAARWVRPSDVADLSEVTWPTVLRLLHRHRPLRAMAWFRAASWMRLNRVPAVAGAVQRRLMRVYGLELSPGAPLGGGLYIAHPVGTTVFAESLGRNVTIVHAVTIGFRGSPPRWPHIGDDVFIGAGARVLGGIVVGAGASVGANAVVLDDVAAGATVVGIPARPVGAPPRDLDPVRAQAPGG